MAKRVKLVSEAKKDNLLKVAIAKVIARINLNTIILAAISVVGTAVGLYFKSKTDDIKKGNDRMTAWQTKRDSVNKVNFANQDTIKTQNRESLAQQKAIIKYFHIKY